MYAPLCWNFFQLFFSFLGNCSSRKCSRGHLTARGIEGSRSSLSIHFSINSRGSLYVGVAPEFSKPILQQQRRAQTQRQDLKTPEVATVTVPNTIEPVT